MMMRLPCNVLAMQNEWVYEGEGIRGGNEDVDDVTIITYSKEIFIRVLNCGTAFFSHACFVVIYLMWFISTCTNIQCGKCVFLTLFHIVYLCHSAGGITWFPSFFLYFNVRWLRCKIMKMFFSIFCSRPWIILKKINLTWQSSFY